VATRPASDLPGPEEIIIARGVRQRLLRAARNTAPIQALARLIGFGTVAFKIQDHTVVRAVVETSEKMEEAT
jgi:hypothetical protein